MPKKSVLLLTEYKSSKAPILSVNDDTPRVTAEINSASDVYPEMTGSIEVIDDSFKKESVLKAEKVNTILPIEYAPDMNFRDVKTVRVGRKLGGGGKKQIFDFDNGQYTSKTKTLKKNRDVNEKEKFSSEVKIGISCEIFNERNHVFWSPSGSYKYDAIGVAMSLVGNLQGDLSAEFHPNERFFELSADTGIKLRLRGAHMSANNAIGGFNFDLDFASVNANAACVLNNNRGLDARICGQIGITGPTANISYDSLEVFISGLSFQYNFSAKAGVGLKAELEAGITLDKTQAKVMTYLGGAFFCGPGVKVENQLTVGLDDQFGERVAKKYKEIVDSDSFQGALTLYDREIALNDLWEPTGYGVIDISLRLFRNIVLESVKQEIQGIAKNAALGAGIFSVRTGSSVPELFVPPDESALQNLREFDGHSTNSSDALGIFLYEENKKSSAHPRNIDLLIQPKFEKPPQIYTKGMVDDFGRSGVEVGLYKPWDGKELSISAGFSGDSFQALRTTLKGDLTHKTQGGDTNRYGLALGLGAGGSSIALTLSSTNPVAMGVVGTLILGAVAYKLGESLYEKHKTKSLPYLDDNRDCHELERMIKKNRNSPLTKKATRSLIAQVDKCNRKNLKNKEAHSLLAIMRYSLENYKPSEGNFLKRWYEENDFEEEIKKYNQGMNRCCKTIKDTFEAGDLNEARGALENLKKAFPYEKIYSDIYQNLYDKGKLQEHSFWLLSKGLVEKANKFHREAFVSADTEMQLSYIEYRHHLGYSNDTQKEAEKLLENFKACETLSEEGIIQKNRIIMQCINAEFEKPVDSISSDYLFDMSDKVTQQQSLEVFSHIDNLFENKKAIIHSEIMQNKEDSQCPENFNQRKISELVSLSEKQLQYLSNLSENDSGHQFFSKKLNLCLALDKFDDATKIANAKLTGSSQIDSDSMATIGKVFSKFAQGNADEQNEKCINIIKKTLGLQIPATAEERAKLFFSLGESYLCNDGTSTKLAIEAYKKGLEYDASDVAKFIICDKLLHLTHFQYEEGQYGDASVSSTEATRLINEIENSGIAGEEFLPLKNKILVMSGLLESKKIYTEQSENYLRDLCRNLPSDYRMTLVNLLDNEYERKISILQKEIDMLSEPNASEEKETLRQQNNDAIAGVRKIQYEVMKTVYECEKKPSLLFNKTLALAAYTKDFDQIQEMISSKLSTYPKKISDKAISEDQSKNTVSNILAIRDVLYYTATENKNNNFLNYAIDKLSEIIDLDLPNNEKAVALLCKGVLISDLGVLNRHKVLECYKQAYALDSHNEKIIRALVEEYCYRHEYYAARGVLKQAFQSGLKTDYDKNLKYIDKKQIQTAQFCLHLFSSAARISTALLKKHGGLSVDSKKYIEQFQLIESLVSSSIDVYLNWITPDSEISSEHLVMFGLGIGIQVTSYLNRAFYTEEYHEFHKIVSWALPYTQSILDVGNVILSIYSVKKLQDKILEINSHNYTDLYMAGLGTLVTMSSYLNRNYFEKWREDGKAPTTFSLILAENAIWLMGNTVTTAFFSLYPHREMIEGALVSLMAVSPELIETLAQYQDIILQQGAEAAAAVAAFWAGAGIAVKILIVTAGGTAAIAALCYGGYKYYRNEKYQNRINNISKQLMFARSHLGKTVEANEYIKTAQQELDIIYTDWEKDEPGALYFQDRLNATNALLEKSDQELENAIFVCNKRLNEKPFDIDFKILRALLFMKAATKTAATDKDTQKSNEGKETYIAQARTELLQVLQLDASNNEAVWDLIILDTIEYKFNVALNRLNTLKSLTPVNSENRDTYKKKEDELLTQMQQMKAYILSHYKQYFHDIKTVWFGSARDNLIPCQNEQFTDGQIYWTEEGNIYERVKDTWIPLSPENCSEWQAKSGHFLLRKDGTFFKMQSGIITSLSSGLEELRALSNALNKCLSSKTVVDTLKKEFSISDDPRNPLYPPQAVQFKLALDIVVDSLKEKDLKEPYENFQNGYSDIKKFILDVRNLFSDKMKSLESENTSIEKKLEDTLNSGYVTEVKTHFQDESNSFSEETSEKLDSIDETADSIQINTETLETVLLKLQEAKREIERQCDLKVEMSTRILWIKIFIDIVSQMLSLVIAHLGGRYTGVFVDKTRMAELPLPHWETGYEVNYNRSLHHYHDKPLVASQPGFWHVHEHKKSPIFTEPPKRKDVLHTTGDITSKSNHNLRSPVKSVNVLSLTKPHASITFLRASSQKSKPSILNQKSNSTSIFKLKGK